MKNILGILIIGLLIITGDIFGQDYKKINFQLNFGTTVAVPYKKTIEIKDKFDLNPQTNYSSNFGYFLEFLISYNLNSRYVISTGLNYNYNSLKIDNKIGFEEDKGYLTSSYLTLPILIKYRLSNKIPISISAGPYIGFLLNANENGTTYIDTAKLHPLQPNDPLIQPIQEYNTDIKKDYTSVDYGLSLQCDYEIKLSNGIKGIILTTRFNYGFRNVITNELAHKNTANYWKNYSLLIGLGIKL